MPANMQNVIYEEVPQSIQQGGVYEKTFDRSGTLPVVSAWPYDYAGADAGDGG